MNKVENNREEIDRASLLAYMDKFPEVKVLVIGDIIMDEYIWGDVSRISPEAPVPVVDVRDETKMLGGAANVIHNITALGARPILCGVVGDDQTGREIIRKVIFGHPLIQLALIGGLRGLDPLHIVGLDSILIKQKSANPGVGAHPVARCSYPLAAKILRLLNT